MSCEDCIYNIDGDFCLAKVFALCDLFSDENGLDKTLYRVTNVPCENYKGVGYDK